MRLSPVKGKRPRRHRAVARTLVVRGAFRGGVGVACGTTRAPSAICFRGATPTPEWGQ
jgi:hypothetical protein